MEPGHCTYREFDPAAPDLVRSCAADSSCVCVSCLGGRCSDSFHIYTGFCTLRPGDSPFESGPKFFYWCPACDGPLCLSCLGIRDDYPCAFSELTSFPFHCPGCRERADVVAVSEGDYRDVAMRLAERCGR